MKALIFNEKLQLVEMEKPKPKSNEVLVQITKAGICATDHEITKGYVPGYQGILGHEFIGTVVGEEKSEWNNQRITAEINFACGECEFCKINMSRHCSHRTVFGIINQNGAFSEFTCVPKNNLIKIPKDIPDSSAIFIEPLAAALEILEQLQVNKTDEVLLIGDGKLAQLIARVLQTTQCKLLVIGKHDDKLRLLRNINIKTIESKNFKPSKFDVVIEASGSPGGFNMGLNSVKPRGYFVIKSTYAQEITWDPSYLVVNEITMVGSRCGQFSQAIDFLQQNQPDLTPLIEQEYPFSQAIEAFEYSQQRGVKKVLLNF